jgi:hypothetical protein
LDYYRISQRPSYLFLSSSLPKSIPLPDKGLLLLVVYSVTVRGEIVKCMLATTAVIEPLGPLVYPPEIIVSQFDNPAMLIHKSMEV